MFFVFFFVCLKNINVAEFDTHTSTTYNTTQLHWQYSSCAETGQIVSGKLVASFH